MKENNQITIGCVGMTHLGLVHAVAFAEQGFQLICYDAQTLLIEQLQAHQMPVKEPQLDDLVKRNATRLCFTADITRLKTCDLVFIAYDVPTDDQGNSNLAIIHQLIASVKGALADKASLVLLSQVPPGFTRQLDIEKHRLFYQVETLIFGNAMARALYPERYIVGAEDPTLSLPDAYLQLLSSFNCPVLTMRYESAELAKISINMFLVASVTTTNTLAEICEHIGADWHDIAPTLRLDKRIGQHAYLTPGLGIAGGNLERDLNTIIKLGQTHATHTDMVSAWLTNSHHRRDWVLRCLQSHVLSRTKDPLICILGLAYKPNTHSVKNSPSIALIKQLQAYRIKAHDPIVQDQHGTHAERASDLWLAIKDADVLIIMTPCTEYQDLSITDLLQHMRGNTIIDPHRLLQLNKKQLEPVNYYSLGQGTIQQKEIDYA